MTVKRLRETLFTYRGYMPLPFLAAMIVFAHPTGLTMAVGCCVAILGESIRFWGVAYAGALTRVTGGVGAPEVIVAGPFAHVRNPLYVGNILTYVGIGIMSNALVPWLVFGAAFWFVFQYSQIVALEEEFLDGRFGESYREFKRNVPRFIPRLTAYRHDAQARQHVRWNEAVRSERRTFQALVLVMLVLLALSIWR
jgi:protein-S-isoprenylcysteine O-methyltransferase Ste14